MNNETGFQVIISGVSLVIVMVLQTMRRDIMAEIRTDTILISVSRQMSTHPAPAIGKISSVQRVSLSSLFSKSFRATSASASTIPPAIAPTSEPWTPWSWKFKSQPLKSIVFKWQSWLILVKADSGLYAIAHCSSHTCKNILPGGGNQLSTGILHHWLGQALPFQSIICKPKRRWAKDRTVDYAWVCVNGEREKCFIF